MPVTTRLSNLGYGAIIRETTPGTARIPNVFLPLLKDNVSLAANLNEDKGITGNRAARYGIYQGMRQYTGTLDLIAEPNTLGYFLDAMLLRGTESGAGPYTHPYTLGEGDSLTLDLLKGTVVHRYFGVKVHSLTPTVADNLINISIGIEALGEFASRDISATPVGSGPYTITLSTSFTPTPTKGLVVGDVMTLYKADGTTVDFTVATIPSDTTITTVVDVTSGLAGDQIAIRAQTPTYNFLRYFEWGYTEFRFGSTAAIALTATHTPVSPGSMWTLSHEIDAKQGGLSGSLDPQVLPRLLGDGTLKIHAFFNTPDDYQRFLNITKRACVIRHFSESLNGTPCELRITFNNMKAKELKDPIETGNLIYQDIEFMPQFDASDGQMFDVKILNNISTYAFASTSPSASGSPSASRSPSASTSPSSSVSLSTSPSSSASPS